MRPAATLKAPAMMRREGTACHGMVRLCEFVFEEKVGGVAAAALISCFGFDAGFMLYAGLCGPPGLLKGKGGQKYLGTAGRWAITGRLWADRATRAKIGGIHHRYISSSAFFATPG